MKQNGINVLNAGKALHYGKSIINEFQTKVTRLRQQLEQDRALPANAQNKLPAEQRQKVQQELDTTSEQIANGNKWLDMLQNNLAAMNLLLQQAQTNANLRSNLMKFFGCDEQGLRALERATAAPLADMTETNKANAQEAANQLAQQAERGELTDLNKLVDDMNALSKTIEMLLNYLNQALNQMDTAINAGATDKTTFAIERYIQYMAELKNATVKTNLATAADEMYAKRLEEMKSEQATKRAEQQQGTAVAAATETNYYIAATNEIKSATGKIKDEKLKELATLTAQMERLV